MKIECQRFTRGLAIGIDIFRLGYGFVVTFRLLFMYVQFQFTMKKAK